MPYPLNNGPGGPDTGNCSRIAASSAFPPEELGLEIMVSQVDVDGGDQPGNAGEVAVADDVVGDLPEDRSTRFIQDEPVRVKAETNLCGSTRWSRVESASEVGLLNSAA